MVLVSDTKKEEEKTISELFNENPELKKLLESNEGEPKEKKKKEKKIKPATLEERRKEREEAKERKFNELFEAKVKIESTNAKDAKGLCYTVRSMVQTTLPHSRLMVETERSKILRESNPNLEAEYIEDKKSSYTRINGDARLMVIPNPEYGLPFGNIPRLVIAWLVTEVVLKKERKVMLGENLSHFLKELNLGNRGGKRGDITRLREQLNRLFSCSIQYTLNKKTNDRGEKIDISNKYVLWWDEETNKEEDLEVLDKDKKSYVLLSENFYNDTLNNPIPLDMRIVRALQDSSLALDIYCWITYKNSYTEKPVAIPWEMLQKQFGANYPETSQGKRNFKKKFLLALKEIAVLYPEAGKLKPEEKILWFVPGKPSVSRQIESNTNTPDNQNEINTELLNRFIKHKISEEIAKGYIFQYGEKYCLAQLDYLEDRLTKAANGTAKPLEKLVSWFDGCMKGNYAKYLHPDSEAAAVSEKKPNPDCEKCNGNGMVERYISDPNYEGERYLKYPCDCWKR